MTLKKSILFLIVVALISANAYYFYPYRTIAKELVVDNLVVVKSKQQLLAYSKGNLIKTYSVAIGRVPVGDKQFEGYHKTPEGTYFINSKNAQSAYHKNLGISYPNSKDLLQANTLGKSAGGDVKIHGLKNGRGWIGRFQSWVNWTNGCVASMDKEVDDLYEHTSIGTPITINP